MKTKTSPWDVAKHLRTPEEMAAYLEACIEKADGAAAFIAKALGDIARAQGMAQRLPEILDCLGKAFTRPYLASAALASTQS